MGLMAEIAEQPDVTRRLLRELPAELGPVVDASRERRVGLVTIAARGSSDHAAVYAQYALGGLARMPVALAAPSLVTRYGTPPRLDQALVLGISQSGQSPDIVGVVAEARAQGAITAAITNDVASPLARAAEHVLALRAGEERSIAATKTYTAQLLVMAMLAAELADDPQGRRRELAQLPDVQRAALEGVGDVDHAARELAPMTSCVVLGRGYNLATALEWALKLKELAGIQAQAYSTADYQHGPVASLASGGHVLALRARGPLLEELDTVLDQVRSAHGARVLAVSGDPPGPETAHLPFPDELPEWLSPLVAILPAQRFTAALAVARGLDPEQPAGLSKVTLTR